MSSPPQASRNPDVFTRRRIALIASAAVIALVLVFVWLIPLLTHSSPANGCDTLDCGPYFAVGNVHGASCPSEGSFASTGCALGQRAYNITIEGSTIKFGQILFHVETPNGTTYDALGGDTGFSVLNASGTIVAQFLAPGGSLAMTSGWTYTKGTSGSTFLGNTYSILVDLGTTYTVGEGLSFIAIGTGAFGGSTSGLTLP
jgi:hypothetical protein